MMPHSRSRSSSVESIDADFFESIDRTMANLKVGFRPQLDDTGKSSARDRIIDENDHMEYGSVFKTPFIRKDDLSTRMGTEDSANLIDDVEVTEEWFQDLKHPCTKQGRMYADFETGDLKYYEGKSNKPIYLSERFAISYYPGSIF